MLIALLRANSGKPFFQYRFNFWQKITLSKNSAIIRCYSEVMTSPFYLVKLESFTLKVCQLELKKGCQPKLLFERFGAISNIVRRTMFEMAPKRSESNFGWQPFFSSSWQTFYSKTLQFYYVKLTSHNFWINADKRKIF